MSEKYKLVDTWVREAKAGDQKASELLLHTFRPLMLSMVQKYVYNPAEYEDGLQEKCHYSHSKRIKKRLLKNPVNYDVFAIYIDVIN